MKYQLFALLMSSATLLAQSPAPTVYVTLDSDAVLDARSMSRRPVEVFAQHEEIAVLGVSENELDRLSAMMHEKHGRCGGFILHEDLQDARAVLRDATEFKAVSRRLKPDFQLTQPMQARLAERKVDAARIEGDIEHLQSYHNRYYRSAEGVESAHWVAEHWKSILEGVEGSTVETVDHSGYPQPSVIATIPGSDRSDEIVILGGHLDSTAGWGGSHVHAPGADDNASGIASLSEILRVLVDMQHRPSRTLQFMAYAAEEVGLRGSNDIARRYREQNRNVLGVLQLDMTNFNGSERDIYIYEDYTSVHQNQFLRELIDVYLKDVTHGSSQCGYGCSDHASWTRHGFSASFPNETHFEEHNPHIHTRNDLLSKSGSHARHASRFARLGVVYAVEASN